VKRAILSDIHSNLEAIQAVLEDAGQQGVEQVYCLGDIVGYGPDPLACIDLAMQMDVCLLGNHDQAALFDPEGFSSGAEGAIFWTREQLESPPEGQDIEQHRARWQFLAELPRCHSEDTLFFVHGSVRNPLNEYVFPEDVYNVRKLEKIFGMLQRHSFQGHSHVPGVITESGKAFSPEQIDGPYPLGPEKAMINVGSVGQPRDGDPRACYALLADDSVTFRRVDYPRQQTIEKIYSIPPLDNALGDRLREGR